MRSMIGLSCAAAAALGIPHAAVAGDAASPEAMRDALDDLRTTNPGVAIYATSGKPERLYGRPMANGLSPEHSADEFVQAHAGVFGVQPGDLAPIGPAENGAHVVPLMFDPVLGDYRFTLVAYTHRLGDTPVLGSDLRLLVRNEPGYPVVLAASSLEPIAAGTLARTANAKDAPWLVQAAADLEGFDHVESTLAAIHVDPFTGRAVEAVEAILVRGEPSDLDHARERIVLDAASGAELDREDLVHRFNPTGTVTGFATTGNAADHCAPEIEVPLPYARVITDGQIVFADENGAFDFGAPLPDGATVTSTLRGTYFRVFSEGLDDSRPELTVSGSTPLDFVHNAVNDNEFTRAEVNAYVTAHEVRDAVLAVSPAFPVISTETGVRINVNRAPSCNATFSGGTLNFHLSGDCSNTAFRPIVYHEYGHRMVGAAGSGQGQYGEGAGDALMFLITQESESGLGITWDCSVGGRSVIDQVDYPCTGEIHFCGQVLAGSAWETRQRLLDAGNPDPSSVLLPIMVNSIPLHAGTQVTPQITIDWLTLDDDNATLADGTPNYWAIGPGFATRSMDAPRSVCAADADRDGFVTDGDIAVYLGEFFAGDDAADLNGDGIFDNGDLGVFVGLFLAGCLN